MATGLPKHFAFSFQDPSPMDLDGDVVLNPWAAENLQPHDPPLDPPLDPPWPVIPQAPPSQQQVAMDCGSPEEIVGYPRARTTENEFWNKTRIIESSTAAVLRTRLRGAQKAAVLAREDAIRNAVPIFHLVISLRLTSYDRTSSIKRWLSWN
jgi:hypothetical protein